MSDAENRNGGSSGEGVPETGTIINASAQRRPRVHGFEGGQEKGTTGLDFLRDVPLKLHVVLGETTMSLGEVIGLEADSVVQLDKLSGDPIDIYVEDKKLGRGEVVVLHDKIRIRLLEIIPPSESLKEPQGQQQEEE